MVKEFIVAIELGSSKMTGIAGRKNPDGSMTILAVAKEDSTSYIRKGVVYNIDKTAQGLSNIISKLKNTLQTDINQVYIGVGGQSIHSIKNPIIKDLPIDAIVSQDVVNELMDINRNMVYQDFEILDAITEEFKVDSQYQDDPVGIQAKRLEGNYLNILWRRAFYRNLNKSLENAGISIAELYIAPLVMADCVLTEPEKRAGCALVDLGAETTTVSVYFRNKLRYIAVLPLGSNNITKDLEAEPLNIENAEAEALKLKYGCAYTEPEDVDVKEMIPVDGNRSIKKITFIELVEARLLEIIENVNNMIPIEYKDKLLGGIILTGGGCNMKNIDTAFRNVTKINKVRIAKGTTLNINTKDSNVSLPENGTYNTILSLLSKGNLNCAGREFNQSLFENLDEKETVNSANPTTTTTTATVNIVNPETVYSGTTVNTPKPEPKEEKPEPKEEKTEHNVVEEKHEKKTSWFGKLATSLSNFGKSLVEPETDNN